MSRRRPQTIDVDDEEASYTVGQLVWYLKGSYSDREFGKVERLLTKREERIRAEMEKKAERVKRAAAAEVDAMKKEVESADVKYGEAVLLKLVAEESVKKLERECEGLRDAAEMCEKLKREMREMEEDGNERVQKLELKAKVEERLRNSAEEDLRVAGSKLKELELRVVNMRKDIDLIKCLEAAGAPGMGAEKMHLAQAESEARYPVIAASGRFKGGNVVRSVKKVGKTVMEGISNLYHHHNDTSLNEFADPCAGANLISRISTANVKGSDPSGTGMKDKSIVKEKQEIEDAVPRNNLGQPRYIQVSSDSDDDGPSEPKIRSKAMSDFTPIKLEPGGQPCLGSDNDKSNLSSGLKRKHISSFINDDVAETDPHPAINKGILLKTQKGKKVVGNVSHTGSLGDGDPKSVRSYQPKDTAEDLKSKFQQWRKSLSDRLHNVSDED